MLKTGQSSNSYQGPQQPDVVRLSHGVCTLVVVRAASALVQARDEFRSRVTHRHAVRDYLDARPWDGTSSATDSRPVLVTRPCTGNVDVLHHDQ